jgi:Ankyrin repeats (3 copies)
MRVARRWPLVLALGANLVVIVSGASRASGAPGAATTAPAQSPAVGDKAEALAEAARKGDAAAVKQLLDDGVDVNTKYRYERTALSFACDRGNVAVVKVLLDRGADVNAKDTFYGATPLTWAASPAMGRRPEHAEVVGLLLKHGATGKEDALLEAVSAPDAAMIGVILDSGGLSAGTLSDALEAATRDKQPEIAALLEKAGAKPRPEFKIDPAALARYAGTYRNASGNDLVFTIVDGRLTGGPAGQPFTLVARDATTFAVSGAPGLTVAFRLEQDKPVSLAIGRGGDSNVYTRVEGAK